MDLCFHCGLAALSDVSLEIGGRREYFCCQGCRSIAKLIHEGGLGDFYQYREGLSLSAKSKESRRDFGYSSYDDASVQKSFVRYLGDGRWQADFFVEHIQCAACAWLIEHFLSTAEGIEKVSVNVSSRFCRVVTRAKSSSPASVPVLSAIMVLMAQIGYPPQPANAQKNRDLRKQKEQDFLKRLGLAGIAMMQVGMVAIALYLGDAQGISDSMQVFFRHISLIVATPVVFYSAQPFFRNAFFSLRHLSKTWRGLSMDVPVALAIALAYGASAYATLSGQGEVYFDSVSMFTFFLLLGRYIELRAKNKNADELEQTRAILPDTVIIVDAGEEMRVARGSLVRGQHVLVSSGEVIPCDGKIVEGQCAVDESLLTGESLPITKSQGETVYAGTFIGEGRLLLRVEALAEETQIAEIDRLIQDAEAIRPESQALADAVASYFVVSVLAVSFITYLTWYLIAPERALWVALSVLVITCPCALSLATPAVLTRAVQLLRRAGIFACSKRGLEDLARVNYFIFDKTGSLSTGKLTIEQVEASQFAVDEAQDFDGLNSKNLVLAIVAGMEKYSQHPIARAFEDICTVPTIENVKVHLGQGIEARYHSEHFRFGSLVFAQEILPAPLRAALQYPGVGLWQLLASDRGRVAWIKFEDPPRDDALDLLNFLGKQKIPYELVSGDRAQNVEPFARALGIERFTSAAMPETKLSRIKALQAEGYTVAMLGDGINDVPVLSASDVSITLSEASQLAQSKADLIVGKGRLLGIAQAFSLACRVRAKIKQNFTWAIGYNVLALPAAAMGWVPPYLAAIGMSLSSIVVIANALRLTPIEENSDIVRQQ